MNMQIAGYVNLIDIKRLCAFLILRDYVLPFDIMKCFILLMV